MPELVEWGELKRFFDPRLIKAISHPVRAHILAVLNERIASGTEIGEELGADVSSFYHHIEALEELGCIELVETRQRRGATEHFFRATTSIVFDDRAWRELPASVRADLTATCLQLAIDEVAAALEAGSFDGSDAEHTSWTPGRFDPQGWQEAIELTNETLTRLLAIRRESAERLAKSGEPGMSAGVAIFGFKSATRTDESATPW
jgi:DNA-binding transcriptional ArsR family regulator